MATFEIIFNIVTFATTVAVLLYLRHLVKTSGTDPIVDPEGVKRFKEAAPYHLLDK